MLLSPQRIRRTSKLNIVCDGNSLTANYTSTNSLGLTNDYPAQLQRLLAATGLFPYVAVTNLGIISQSWRMMDGLDSGSAVDVDQAYLNLPGSTNILVAWETTNAVVQNGNTPAAAATAAMNYIKNRLAANPGWLILVLSSIPRQGNAGGAQAAIDTSNANLLAADALIKGGLRQWGAKGWVDLRGPGSPFRFADYSTATFNNDPQLWAEASGSRVHLTNAGYGFIASCVQRAVFNLANR